MDDIKYAIFLKGDAEKRVIAKADVVEALLQDGWELVADKKDKSTIKPAKESPKKKKKSK